MDSKEKKKYRQSKKWKAFRKKLLKEADNKCYISGVKKTGKSKRFLQIHHINPESYGRETSDDVVVLSAAQHKLIENLLKRKDFDIEEYCKRLKEIYYKSGGK